VRLKLYDQELGRMVTYSQARQNGSRGATRAALADAA
jgi:hypothetical protein